MNKQRVSQLLETYLKGGESLLADVHLEVGVSGVVECLAKAAESLAEELDIDWR